MKPNDSCKKPEIKDLVELSHQAVITHFGL
jgi:hypothetical protein